MITTTTRTDAASPLLAAARAGKIELSEDYDDLLADLEQRKPQKGFTAVFRRENAGIYARGSTPAEALTALHKVLRQPASPDDIVALLRFVGEPRRQLELPKGLL
jgi:hypothetical protein